MITVQQFRARGREFTGAPLEMISEALADAAVEIDPAVWGRYQDRGHYNLAAHLLCIGPYGKQAKATLEKGGTTSYEREYLRLKKIVWGPSRPLL